MITEPRYSEFTGQREKDKFRNISEDTYIAVVGTNSDGSINTKITDGSGTVDTIQTNGFTGLVALAPGHVSTDNSTSITLLSGATFTGEWENIVNFGVISINTITSHDSAIDGLCIDFSSNANDIDNFDTYSISANLGNTTSIQASTKYFRIVYTNGSTEQTYFRLQTVLKPYYVKPSSHRIKDSISGENDAELVKSVLTGQSDINQTFENVTSYRGALQIDASLVHRIGISEHAKRDLSGSTTLDVAISSGDTIINVVDTTGFSVGDLIRIFNSNLVERSHFHIISIDAGVSLTLNRPIDNDFEIGDNIQLMEISMNKLGTLSSPISYKIQPTVNERWQITRLLITMLDSSSMDDGTFGGISSLTNSVIIRLHIDGVNQTLTHWQSNSDLKDDMFDVEYASKAPAGQFGLSGRWTFLKAEFVADLDGANGDYLEVLIQDDLTDLDDFEIKGQGRLFGG